MTATGPGPTDAAYEVAARPIGRASRRRWGVVLIVGVALAGLVVVKPWSPATETGPAAIAAASSTPAVGPLSSATEPPASARPQEPEVAGPAETWPVTQGSDAEANAHDPRDPSTRTALARYVGMWGVAALGNGPQFVRDETWVDWSAVPPDPSTEIANRILTWPGTGVCTGLPAVLAQPALIAVTTPTGITTDPPIEGWWSGGGRIASLDGSIRDVSPAGSAGVRYLERIDGSLWPDGRYEFHVGGGDQIVALVVCVGRTV